MIATIAIGVLLLSMARMLLFVQSGSSFAQNFLLLFTLTSLFIPHYLGFVLPFSLFWGTYTAVRRLSLNAELVSLSAAGMSFARFNRPLVMLGIVVTLLNAAMLGWLEPWARYTYRAIRFQIENVSPFLAAREGIFTKIGNQTVFVDRIDNTTHRFTNVFVFEEGNSGGSTQITAQEGEVLLGAPPALLLRNGNRMVISATEPQRPENMDFETLTFPLAQPLDKFRDQGGDEQELSLAGLYVHGNSPPDGTTLSEMASELNRKLVIILSSLFLPLLAAVWAQSNARGRNFIQGIVSLVFIVGYQQLIHFGSLLTERTGLSPALTMWPTFGFLAASSLLLVFMQDNGAGRPSSRMAIAVANTWQELNSNLRKLFTPTPSKRHPRHPAQRRPVLNRPGRPGTANPVRHPPTQRAPAR
jgi:lipopolysaccharide export system permease protein